MSRKPGFYERRIFPWLNDRMTASPELVRLRAETLATARGKVVEIGFGTGANLDHYPAAVESITAIEPNAGMNDRFAKTRTSRIPVSTVASPAERIALSDRSADSAVSTLTLCSVSDPAMVLAELRRVLRDDGRLFVLEHGLSADASVARWQQRLNGIQNVVACGCNLNRPIVDLVTAAGFQFESVQTFYAPGIPRTHGWITTGVARIVKAS
jgi:SAM-dependent methyltransferase